VYWVANIVASSFVFLSGLSAALVLGEQAGLRAWDGIRCALNRWFGSRRRNRSPIKHVFVLMLENRAFDHMLGFSGITGTDPNTGLRDQSMAHRNQ